MRNKLQSQARSNFPYWVAGIGTGLFATAFAMIFKQLSIFATDLFLQHFVLWACLVPIAFGLSYYSVRRIAPASSGSGIPQVMAATRHVHQGSAAWLDNLLGLKVMVIKVFSSLICITVGGAIGREGPTIQIGAAIFNFMSRFLPGSHGDDVKKKRAMILAGGAAGIAAAFNTPLGGVVFAIEELATDSFREFRGTVFIAVILAGITAQWILGPYLYFGHPTVEPVSFEAILACMCIAVIAGAGGGFFGKTLYALVKFRKRASLTKHHVYWIMGLSAAAIALAYLSNGSSLGSGAEGINSILAERPQLNFMHPVFRFVSTQVSYLIGGAGGIFSPSLAIGANLGSFLASHVFTSLPNANLFVIVAMTAFLTGVTHAPFTSLVLVMEMIDQPTIVFPLMLGSIIAMGVTKAIQSHSFYELMSEYYLPEGVIHEPHS
jgi:H+/Cl- antiporter ClcA